MKRLLVINPNSSAEVTSRIRESVERTALASRLGLDCIDIPRAPRAIETHADVDAVIPLLIDVVTETAYDAYIIACFSDPGIDRIRAQTGKVIYGIGQCSYLQAMALGDKFGIVSILAESTERQRKYLDRLGFASRLADSIALNLGVADLSSSNTSEPRILEVAGQLVEAGADVIILGCAGMGRYHQTLLEKFSLPVVEPTVAAVSIAASGFLFR